MRMLLLTLAAALVPAAAMAGHNKAADLKLGKSPTSLLGDRLTANIPEKAKIEPRGHSIMAADASGEDETRVVLDSGKARFVMMVYELYALSGKDFEAAIKADMAAQGMAKFQVASLTVAQPLAAFGVTPPSVDGKDEANLVFGAYVRHPDGMVQFLAFYVNPAGAKDVAGWTALARKITLTLAAGKRSLTFKARDHEFRGAGTDKLVVAAPENIVSSTQDGPDFSVYHLRKLAVLGQQAGACGIYLGGFADFQHGQQEIPDGQVKQQDGVLLGQKTKWHVWSSGGRTTAEAMVAHPLQKSLTVHVFCSAASAPEVDALRKMAEGLRSVK